MPSPQYEALIAGMTGDLVAPQDPWKIAREKLDAVHGHPVPAGSRVTRLELGGVRCAWVEAQEAEGRPGALVLCHGGAFVAADGDGYLFYAATLSRICRRRVLLVDYRLAPESPYPAALDDCVAAFRALATGVAPGPIGLIGDSCGGGLVISSLLRLRDEGGPLPAFGVTLGGWLDLEATADSARRPLGRDPFARWEVVVARGRDYVGEGGDLRDPLVSPIHADPTGLPPLYLQVGQIDLTRGDAERFGASAAKAGVHVQVEVVPEMVHGFQGLAFAGVPEAVAALERVRSFADETLGA